MNKIFARIKPIFPTINEIKKARWQILLLAISAFLLRLAFPKHDLWCLAWFSLTPLLVILNGRDYRACFWYGLFFGFVFYYSTIFWLNTLTIYNYFIPIAIILMGFAMGLFVAGFSLAQHYLEIRIPRFKWFYIPVLWIFFEYLRSLGPLGFIWAYLGHTQYQQIALIQIVDITGVYGISFLVVLGNVVLAYLYTWHIARKNNLHDSKPPIGIMMFFLLLLSVYIGYGVWATHRMCDTDSKIQVGVIQPNLPQMEKLASYLHPDESIRNRLQMKIIDDFTRLVLEVQNNAELVVCPETTITDQYFSINQPLKEYILKLAEKVGAPILFGADCTITSSSKDFEKIYNSAWLAMSEQKFFDAVYHKIHLVPFGEYVPLARFIPFLQESIIQIGSFNAGEDSIIFSIAPDKPDFGVLICFESTMPYLVRRLIKRNAEFLVIITNDAWYGSSSGPYQHFVASVFRAVEFRRYVVRSANTGISAIISPTGIIREKLCLNNEGTFSEDISGSQITTFYQRFGEIFTYSLAILIIILLVSQKPRSTTQKF